MDFWLGMCDSCKQCLREVGRPLGEGVAQGARGRAASWLPEFPGLPIPELPEAPSWEKWFGPDVPDDPPLPPRPHGFSSRLGHASGIYFHDKGTITPPTSMEDSFHSAMSELSAAFSEWTTRDTTPHNQANNIFSC